MANLNKVMLIGRLTDQPTEIPVRNGGRGVKFRFAVNNRKKDQNTGQWVDDPVFMDVEAWNRGENGKTADLILQYLGKGKQVFIEGHLRLDQWEDKNGGGKRSKLVVVVDNVQFLEPRQDGMGGGGGDFDEGARSERPAARGPAPAAKGNGGSHYDNDEPVPARGGSGSKAGPVDDDIPF